MVQVNKALGSERMVRRVPPIPVTAREFKIVTFAPPASAQPGDVMELTVDGQVVSVEALADLWRAVVVARPTMCFPLWLGSRSRPFGALWWSGISAAV